MAEETCSQCGGRGTYWAELPNSGDTGGTYVRCNCEGDLSTKLWHEFDPVRDAPHIPNDVEVEDG